MKTIFRSLYVLFHVLPYVATSLFTFTGYADSGYRLEIEIEGLQNSKAYLGYYEGTQPYLIDSAMTNSKGKIHFKGNVKLNEGVYFFYTKEANFSFDFVVTDSKTSLKTSIKNPLGKLVDLESSDNAIFFLFRKEINGFQKDMENLGQLLTSAQDKKDSLKYVIRMKKREFELLEWQKQLIDRHKNTIIGCILQYMRLPEQPPLYSEKWENPKYQNKRNSFYRSHFWDHINFNDSLLLRVPILKYRLNEFFDQVVTQQPDSIIKAMDEVMLKTMANKAVHKQTLMELTYKYISPPLLDQDKAFVHFADSYILTDQASDWINTNTHDHISNIAEKMRPSTIGKKAPPLLMPTLKGKEIDLYSIKSRYTILFFYDPDCEHCMVESEKLKNGYKEFKKKGAEVMAVCISSDLEKCKQYVTDSKIEWMNVLDPTNNTGFKEKYNIFAAPIIFLLDHEKQIIGKATEFDQIAYQLL